MYALVLILGLVLFMLAAPLIAMAAIIYTTCYGAVRLWVFLHGR